MIIDSALLAFTVTLCEKSKQASEHKRKYQVPKLRSCVSQKIFHTSACNDGTKGSPEIYNVFVH